jgi:hypothetical protein
MRAAPAASPRCRDPSCSRTPALAGDGFRRRPICAAVFRVRLISTSAASAARASRRTGCLAARGRIQDRAHPGPHAPTRAAPECRDTPEVNQQRQRAMKKQKGPDPFGIRASVETEWAVSRPKTTHLPSPDQGWRHRNPAAWLGETCAHSPRARTPTRQAGCVWWRRSDCDSCVGLVCEWIV